jgi:prefoldin alpha subunit
MREETNKELQKKILAYRILYSRLEGLVQQRELIAQKILEIQTTIASINEVSKGKNVLFSLGSEAHIYGSINEKKKLIVEIGAGIALEKDMKEAKNILEERIKDLGNILKKIDKSIKEVSDAINQLIPEIQTTAGDRNV